MAIFGFRLHCPAQSARDFNVGTSLPGCWYRLDQARRQFDRLDDLSAGGVPGILRTGPEDNSGPAIQVFSYGVALEGNRFRNSGETRQTADSADENVCACSVS